MQLLRNIVEQHNVHRWAQSFLDAAATLATKAFAGLGDSGASQLAKPELARPEVSGVTPIAAARTRSRSKSATM